MSEQAEKPLLIERLSHADCYDAVVDHVRVVETHISWVFLTGQYAYKIKKPIKLPFLDFSTLELRRHFCEQELQLNRRLAPQLYLEVVGIGGTPDAPRFGATPTLEYAVKMRQFPDDARLDRQLAADTLPAGAIVELAERIAQFHIELPPITQAPGPGGAAATVIEAAMSNVEELQGYLEEDRRDRYGKRYGKRFAAIRSWTRQRCTAIEPTLAQRFAERRHREGHGDLHLENLILLEGEILAFDALEFNPELRRADVMSETGFLAMDLLAHGRSDAAYLFLNRYLEVTGDYGGLDVLRFYLVYRALVRAKVRLIKVRQRGAAGEEHDGPEPYLELAGRLAGRRKPLLLLMHGLSGSGKTHVSTELVGRLPALRARSDLERKRLEGIEAQARSHSPVGGGLYDRDSTQRTYERLRQIVRQALGNELDLIVDATFLRAAERGAFRELARQLEARFAILDCSAPEAVLRQRIEARSTGRDASEATQQVLDSQLRHRDPLSSAEQAVTISVDTASAIDYGRLGRRLARVR